MAFNTSGLSDYIALQSTDIATKAVASAKTAQALIASNNTQPNVKGSAPILKLSSTVTFQSGSGCGRVSMGSTSLSNKFLEVVPIKSMTELCPKSLYNTYYNFALGTGQDPKGETISNVVVDKMIDDKILLVGKSLEDLLWRGNKVTQTGTTNNLRFINGIQSQVATVSGSTEVTVTGSTVVEKLQALWKATPVAISSAPDFRIFIGEDLYKDYVIAIANKNIYKPVDDTTLFGTTAQLFPTSGLDGTGYVYAMTLSNLQYGFDGDKEEEKFELFYSKDANVWYEDLFFAAGIAVVNNDEVYFSNDF